MIVTVPFLLKNVTSPSASTVAILSSDVLHVTVLSVASSGSTVAFSCNVLSAFDTVVTPDLELTVTPVGATSVESRISNASSSIFVLELAVCFLLSTFSWIVWIPAVRSSLLKYSFCRTVLALYVSTTPCDTPSINTSILPLSLLVQPITLIPVPLNVRVAVSPPFGFCRYAIVSI